MQIINKNCFNAEKSEWDGELNTRRAIYIYKQRRIILFVNGINYEVLNKISKDFGKFSKYCSMVVRTFPIIFRKYPKLPEDFRRRFC